MNTLRALYRGEQQFDFPRLWRITLALSAVMLVIGVGSLLTRGLNLGIEFEGGSSWEVEVPGASVADVRDALAGTEAEAGKIQTVGEDGIKVRAAVEDEAAVQEVTDALAEFAGVDPDEITPRTVSASWGDQITEKARNALIWFFVLVAIYIAVRLEWKMAVGALVAVVHDILISVGVYSVFQFEVTPATVIAFLTITGYSLYDTVVVYDKVRDVTGRLGSTGRYTYREQMNLALNQVIMRSINTSVTSLLPVVSMLVIGSFFLGAVTLREFAIALFVGLVVGAYSSIFVASAVVAYMKEREPANVAIARKLAARGVDDTEGTRPVDADEATLGAVAARTGRPPATGPRPTGAPPRPRKKKKKR